MRHITKGEKHLDSQNKVSPEQMETVKKYCFQSDSDHNYYLVNKQQCPSCFNICKAISDEREKALSDAETVADIEHDEKCCSHEHCEYNCHAKGFNEASERITQAIRQLKGKP